MTNVSKLKGRIYERGYNYSSFAPMVGMSRSTLRSRVCGESEFTAKEIVTFCDALHIPVEEMPEYFFEGYVPKK